MQKFHILVLKNGIDYATEGELERARDWIKRWTKVPTEISISPTSLDLRLKDNTPILWNGKLYKTYALDGIKEQIRGLKFIEKNKYHAVVFIYNAAKFQSYWGDTSMIPAWTYPNPLFGNDVFVEIPSLVSAKDDLMRIFTHEFCHVLHRLCWQKGIPTWDSMDIYDSEMQPEALNGNRARNILVVKPYLQIISQELSHWLLISVYQGIVSVLTGLIALMKQSRLDEWAEAIKLMEGWYPGSRSQKNNNPGNLKYAKQAGTIGQDNGGFAIFKTYEDGFNALKAQLRRAATPPDTSVYWSDMNLFEFFAKYAPSFDENNPHSYALFVANRLGVSPLTKIKELV